jgi:hypothetical protein
MTLKRLLDLLKNKKKIISRKSGWYDWCNYRTRYKRLIANYNATAGKLAIFMCNVNYYFDLGGLADRLRGAVYTYKICKENNIDFAINFVYPFVLQDFLQPNQYNWLIDNKAIIYDKTYSEPIINTQIHKRIFHLEKQILKSRKKQLHIYTNACNWQDFSQLFNELFKPTEKLQQQIDFHYNKMNGNYIGLTFRFQFQLGDFNEYNLQSTLSEDEKTALINRCIEQIYAFHEKYPQHPTILVTSDSITFLNEAKKIDFVYVIEGQRYHCDTDNDNKNAEYMLSFLDMFLLSKAQRVFCPVTDNMYQSGFPQVSALINDVPFEWVPF